MSECVSIERKALTRIFDEMRELRKLAADIHAAYIELVWEYDELDMVQLMDYSENFVNDSRKHDARRAAMRKRFAGRIKELGIEAYG